jgi:hypothetical protein
MTFKSRTLYASLMDQYGTEMFYPGYCRQPVNFTVSQGRAVSDSTISFPAMAAGNPLGVSVHQVGIHESSTGELLFAATLDRPSTILNGDTISMGSGGLTIDTNAFGISTAFSRSGTVLYDLPGYLATLPAGHEPTREEIWDAAFTAGHQVAHTLLTGDAE